MIDSGHDRRDDIAAYALGALERADAESLEGHLRECGACRAYLARMWPAVDALALSVPPLEPPPELRNRLVATARSDARRIAATARESARPARFARGGWRRIVARPATALAAGAILCGGAAIGYALHGGGSPSRSVVPLRPTAAAPGGTMAASLIKVDGQGMLRVDRMPPPGRGRVYEVWTQRGATMRPQSTFLLRQDGSGAAAVPSLGGASAVLVTEEPRGGSDQPTSPVLMRANLR